MHVPGQTPTLDVSAVRWRRTSADAPLVVLLHGVGSHEVDLFGLTEQLPAGVNVASLRAPRPWPGGGFAWFDLGVVDGGTITYDEHQIEAAGRSVVSWLAAQADAFDRVVLMGFSQGAATALQVASLVPERVSACVMLSGFLPFSSDVPGPGVPLFVAVGEQDQVIGSRGPALAQWAAQAPSAQVRHYPIGHWVVADELRDVRDFLTDVLG